MKPTTRTDHRAQAEALRRRVLEGPGETDAALRRSVAETAAGAPGAASPYDALARQIAHDAAGTTDDQVAKVVAAAGSEKAAFELIFTAAVSAGLLRWRAAIAALDGASDAPR